MGRAESVIVIIKVAILIVFIVAAFIALTGKGLPGCRPLRGRVLWRSLPGLVWCSSGTRALA